MKNIAIFGAAGAIGHSVAAELERRSLPFRVVGRNRDRLLRGYPNAADCVSADLANFEAAEWAASGIDTIFYTVGVARFQDFHLHPGLMHNTIDAAVKAKVERIVVVTSVYSYGPPRTPKVAETHPREPAARKGKFRKRQEDMAMDSDRGGSIRALVVHLPDFYGPHAELSLAHEVVKAASSGKRAPWFGSVDLPHEFIYVPDAGNPIVELASHDDCFGQHWNVAGPGTITGREFMNQVFQELGKPPKWLQVSKTMLRLLGLFNPMMREFVELSYLGETPVILDDSKLSQRLGASKKTAYKQGIEETIAWMRRNA